MIPQAVFRDNPTPGSPNASSNHGIHRTVGPVTALAPKRECSPPGSAGPEPRQDHPPVMPSVGQGAHVTAREA
jgi:hypothetical protein